MLGGVLGGKRARFRWGFVPKSKSRSSAPEGASLSVCEGIHKFPSGPEQTCVKRQQFCRLGNFRRKLFGAHYSFVPGLSHDSRCDSSLALILGGLYQETSIVTKGSAEGGNV